MVSLVSYITEIKVYLCELRPGGNYMEAAILFEIRNNAIHQVLYIVCSPLKGVDISKYILHDVMHPIICFLHLKYLIVFHNFGKFFTNILVNLE